jgi:hypothetical protein
MWAIRIGDMSTKDAMGLAPMQVLHSFLHQSKTVVLMMNPLLMLQIRCMPLPTPNYPTTPSLNPRSLAPRIHRVFTNWLHHFSRRHRSFFWIPTCRRNEIPQAVQICNGSPCKEQRFVNAFALGELTLDDKNHQKASPISKNETIPE